MFWIHTWLPQLFRSVYGEFVNLYRNNVAPALYTICHQRHVRSHFYYCGYFLRWVCSQCMVFIITNNNYDSWCDLKQVCLWWFFFLFGKEKWSHSHAYCIDIAYICYIYGAPWIRLLEHIPPVLNWNEIRERSLNSLMISLNHFWTHSALWEGTLSCRKSPQTSGNTVWLKGLQQCLGSWYVSHSASWCQVFPR